MHTKQAAYRTYVIGAKIPKGKIPYSLWWDTGDKKSIWANNPYHYARLQPFDETADLLLVGGEDHKVGQADDEKIPETARYLKLIEWAKKHFPDVEAPAYQWSGQVIEPVDGLAFFGKNPGDDNIYIITSDAGNGMTHSTIGALIINDLINGRDNEWAAVYDPSRITLKSTGTFLQEAVNMVSQYADWLSEGDIKEVEELQVGEGAIPSSGMKHYAVYRDAQGMLHTCTAVCPHMGGILQWNADEQSFDCPLHGSRFTTGGVLMNGPAVGDLKQSEIKTTQHAH